MQSAFSWGILPLGAQIFYNKNGSSVIISLWKVVECASGMPTFYLIDVVAIRGTTLVDFTVLCLVKGFLKLINGLISLPTWRQKHVCMRVCAPMCACLYAHPARASAIPRAASSKAVSGNLLSAQSHSAGPAQLLCMLSTKQISLEGGGKIEGSICSFLLHCADARLR